MSGDGFRFSHQLVVRFADCDPMGHANHAAYFTYFEQCRLTWWREAGGANGLPGANTVIVHAECDYRVPARAHDRLDVRVSVESIGRSSVILAYAIVNVATGTRVAEGRTVTVTLDPGTGQPIRVPEAARALLEGQKSD